MRLAVTGSTGRLGNAVIEIAGGAPDLTALGWTRTELDLDAPEGVAAALDRDRPDIVVHCAAWTDVDGCAREPDLAARRNGVATRVLAEACAARAIGLLAVSTNEVFDGRRSDGRGYSVDEAVSPANPYGASKRLGEEGALAAFAGSSSPLWITRTAWLFGRPGADFPTKIITAATAASAEGRTLKLVGDEIGSPTYARDLATAIIDLVTHPDARGIHHVVNAGRASRAEWARRVLDLAGISVATEDVPMSTWTRASTPPAWGVLEPTRLPTLSGLRPWPAALAEDMAARRAGIVSAASAAEAGPAA